MTNFSFPGFAKALSLGGFWLALATSTPAVAGTIVVGTPADIGKGNCFPFGCNYDTVGDGQYQQVYTNSLFSGPVTITGLEFYNTQDNTGGATAMNTGTFTISLSTTSADWDTLSTTPANNIGADDTEVFSGSLAQPWSFGDMLSILFTTPFSYTPGAGANLLLNVVATGTGAVGGTIFFDANGLNGFGFNGNTIFGRYFNGGSVGIVESGYGLVTGFDTSSAESPEPGTLALLGFGLVGLEIVRLRRNRRALRSDTSLFFNPSGR